MRVAKLAIACSWIVVAHAGEPRAIDLDLPRADLTFVSDAAADNQAALALAQLAVARSTAMRDLGRMLVDDRQYIANGLRQLATRKHLTLPAQLSPAQEADRQQLEQLPERRFDRAYLEQARADLQRTIALFENEARAGADGELRAFARTTLATLHGDERALVEWTRLVDESR
jgi:putative membrane protein